MVSILTISAFDESNQWLHHVTAIAGPAQENLDFYSGVLGLRLVKKSVNQDDPGTYHLFYADAEGHPGTDLTFFPWAELAPHREGYGLSSEVSLAIPPGSLRILERAAEQKGVRAFRTRNSLWRTRPAAGRSAWTSDRPVESQSSLGRQFLAVEEEPDPGRTANSRAGKRADAGAGSGGNDCVSGEGIGFRKIGKKTAGIVTVWVEGHKALRNLCRSPMLRPK